MSDGGPAGLIRPTGFPPPNQQPVFNQSPLSFFLYPFLATWLSRSAGGGDAMLQEGVAIDIAGFGTL